jgi:hypothetical protein
MIGLALQFQCEHYTDINRQLSSSASSSQQTADAVVRAAWLNEGNIIIPASVHGGKPTSYNKVLLNFPGCALVIIIVIIRRLRALLFML